MEYEVYDNFPEAINVDKCKDIPIDYEGLIGVPVTYLDKFNPHEYQIMGIDKDFAGCRFKINGKSLYARLIIKRSLIN